MVSKELQSKYIQLQMMKQQLGAFIQEKNLIDEKSSELSNAINAMKKLEDVKMGSEIWSPVGAGAFVRSDVKDTENVLIGVGAGVVLKKNRADAVTTLESRLSEITALDRNIVAEIKKFSQQFEALEKEVEKLAEKEQS